MGTSPTLECTVEHKNAEDTSFTSAGVFSSMTSANIWKLDVSSLKEEIAWPSRLAGRRPITRSTQTSSPRCGGRIEEAVQGQVAAASEYAVGLHPLLLSWGEAVPGGALIQSQVRGATSGLHQVHTQPVIGPGKCVGCAVERPCASCSEVFRSPETPLVQAMQWGLLVTRDVHESFWGAAATAEVLRRAPARDGSSVWEAAEHSLAEATIAAAKVVVTPSGGCNATDGPPWLSSLLACWEGESEEVPKPTCCPELKYPEGLVQSDDPRCGQARMPQYGVSSRKKACKFGFTFRYSARFSSTPPPCSCPCCEFGQDLLKNVVTLTCGAGGPGGKYEDPGAGGQDCTWYYKWDDTGEPYTRTGPADKPPAAYPGSKLFAGPYCPGNRKETPPGEGTPPGTKPQPPDPGYSGDGCRYKGKDSPSIVVPAGCNFVWSWGARGYIKDTCAGGTPAEGKVEIEMTGSVRGSGVATLKSFKRVP